MAKFDALNYSKNIKPENLKPIYLIHGEEPYFTNLIADRIQEIAVPEFEKGFNEIVLYGKDVSIGAILNNARRFPMMAERQLVLIKEAQDIQDLGNSEQEALLENYIKSPLKSTILVFVSSKSLDERKVWIKNLKKEGEVIKTSKLYENELPGFIGQFLSEKGLKITPKAGQLLIEHIGNNLQSIALEIDKVLPNVKEKNQIDEIFIEQYVGISKDYNVFELQKALGNRNSEKSFQIVKYFADNPKEHPIQPVIIILYNFFTKLMLAHSADDKSDSGLASLLKVNTYFIRDYLTAMRNYPLGNLVSIISAIRIADQKSKGIDAGSDSILTIYNELIYRILN